MSSSPIAHLQQTDVSDGEEFLQTGFRKYAADETLDRWGAGGEDDAWPSDGTSVRGDRQGLGPKVRHDPGHGKPDQRGSRPQHERWDA